MRRQREAYANSADAGSKSIEIAGKKDEQMGASKKKSGSGAAADSESATARTVTSYIGQSSKSRNEVAVCDGRAVTDPKYKESG